jgi:hypothetical protein
MAHLSGAELWGGTKLDRLTGWSWGCGKPCVTWWPLLCAIPSHLSSAGSTQRSFCWFKLCHFIFSPTHLNERKTESFTPAKEVPPLNMERGLCLGVHCSLNLKFNNHNSFRIPLQPHRTGRRIVRDYRYCNALIWRKIKKQWLFNYRKQFNLNIVTKIHFLQQVSTPGTEESLVLDITVDTEPP